MTKKKLLLVGIYDTNTCSLAPWVLKSCIANSPAAKQLDIQTVEFSIFTDNAEAIHQAIQALSPDIVGFSAYIWNIDIILKATQGLDSIVILGGPQVTGIEDELLDNYPNIDYIIRGEGESSLVHLLSHLTENKTPEHIPGLFARGITPEENLPNKDLNIFPSPYSSMLDANAEMSWISYETSRGCPYGCRYCTWSTDRKMRYYDMDRVLDDLKGILAHPNISEIYFCDSSLLLNQERAKAILQFIIDSKTEKRIRFEFMPTQLTSEIMDMLALMPNNEFNFGVQTTNPDALKEIGRKFSVDEFEEKYKEFISRFPNAKITLDLIYGLPGDTIEGFRNSMEYALRLPHLHRILTNQLLALPGSEFFQNQDHYGIKLMEDGSYRVRASNTFDESAMEQARRDSFYVSLIHLNSCFADAIRDFASSKNARIIDTILAVMMAMPPETFPEVIPDMIPSVANGFRLRNAALRHVISNYSQIIEAFEGQSGISITGYEDHFSEQYHRLRRYI